MASATLHAAIEVPRVLGPGFLEGVYENALDIERTDRGLHFVRQPTVPVVYKRRLVGDGRLDLLVEGCLVVELKAVDPIAPVHLRGVRRVVRSPSV